MSNKYKKVKNKDMYFLGSLIGEGVGTIAGALGANEKTQGLISGGVGLATAAIMGDPISGVQGATKMLGAATMAEGGSLTQFNTGGRHESNPLGGIPIGQNALVEEGETKSGDFVYSDRVIITPQVAKEFSIPKRFIGKTFADASKFYDDKERANDPITKRGTERELDNLALAQESFKAVESGQDIGRNVRQMAYGGGIKLAEGGSTDEYESMVASKIMPKGDSKNPFSVSIEHLRSLGYSKPQIEKILDLSYKIASQESGFNFKDGYVDQDGGGPGKGIFQYEAGKNSVDALASYYKMMKEKGNTDDPIYKEIASKVKRPNAYKGEIFLDNSDNYSNDIAELSKTDEFKRFSNLNRFSAAGQHAIFIADKVYNSKKGLDSFLSGDLSAPDFWAKHHGRFAEKDVKDRLKSWSEKEDLFDAHIDDYSNLLKRNDKPVVTPFMDNKEIMESYRPDWKNPTSKKSDPKIMAEGGSVPTSAMEYIRSNPNFLDDIDYKQALIDLHRQQAASINEKTRNNVTYSSDPNGITEMGDDPAFLEAVGQIDNDTARRLLEGYNTGNLKLDPKSVKEFANTNIENNIPRNADPSQPTPPDSGVMSSVDVTAPANEIISLPVREAKKRQSNTESVAENLNSQEQAPEEKWADTLNSQELDSFKRQQAREEKWSEEAKEEAKEEANSPFKISEDGMTDEAMINSLLGRDDLDPATRSNLVQTQIQNNIPREPDPSQLEQPNSNIGQAVDVTERRQSLPLNNFDYLSQNPGLIGDLAMQRNIINAVTPIDTQRTPPPGDPFMQPNNVGPVPMNAPLVYGNGQYQSGPHNKQQIQIPDVNIPRDNQYVRPDELPAQINPINPKSAEYSLPSLPQSPEESLPTGTEKDVDRLSNVSEFKLGDTLNAAGKFAGDNLRYAPALTSAVNLGISAFSKPDMIDPSQFQTNQQFNPNLVDRNQLRRDAVSRTNAMIGNARQATSGNAGAFMANAAAANAQGQRAIGQANLQADVADAGELGRIQQLRAQQAQRNTAMGLQVQNMNDANQQSYQAQLMDQIANLGNNLGGVGVEQYRINNINNSGAWLYGTEGQFTGNKKENE